MAKISLMIRKKDCMGCHACEVACKQEHGLGVGPRLVRVIEHSIDFTPVYCHHCAKAPCKQACPVDAISRNEQGIVLIDSDLCIGCRDCIEACPFGAIEEVDWRDATTRQTRTVAHVIESLCHGCGNCVVACRAGAPDIAGFTNEQVYAQVEALAF